ncbi:hypothetical protein [Falsiphaeobacter marinintestinus]|uniref:hypothetical protein n=1 Tax=Falsiphaeobacter marinintestinus TaxID=1492905 RepID=UPI0016467F1F|nr:hypothetical protein [Phaeobacter marinintestinus]
MMVSQHVFAKAVYEDRFDWIQERIDALPEYPDTIISSEWFARVKAGRKPRLNRLAEILTARFDTRVIYYARHPVPRSISDMQQTLKGGTRTLSQMYAKPKIYNLRRDLREFANAFGRQAMIVRKFSRLAFVQGDLLSDFCACIDRHGLLDHVKRETHNQSMSQETALAIEAYRAKTGDKRNIGAQDPRFFVENGTKFTLPNEVIQKILADTAQELDWLQETYGIDLRQD